MNNRHGGDEILAAAKGNAMSGRNGLHLISIGIIVSASGCASSPWARRSAELRDRIAHILTLPDERIDLAPVTHRLIADVDFTIEAITYASERGSRVTASLYLPIHGQPVPAVVVACGHGGSKSCLYAQYAGQLYARLGFACLVPDTIGEEEREKDGRLGARGHDLYHLGDRNPEFVRTKLKRMVLGKIVWDLIRGMDYLETRAEVDASRIGIVGYSLGGASAGCVAMLDPRVDAAIVCGWVFRERYATWSKYCTRLPHAAFARVMRFDEMTALVAPHAATIYLCGENDSVIDPDEAGAAVVRDLQANVAGAHAILNRAKMGGVIQTDIVPEADHRPFFLNRRAVAWLQRYLMKPEQRKPIPRETVAFGEWVDTQGQQIEKLYNTEARERGLLAVDIKAVYRDPRQLACFPYRRHPTPEYTMQGWVDTHVRANAGQ